MVGLLLTGAQASAAIRCEQLITRPEFSALENQRQVLTYIATNLSEQKADAVIKTFLDVFERSVMSHDDRTMSEAQFFALYSELKHLAGEYGIRIEPTTDTMGVFPKGLDLIGIAGFSEPTATTSMKNVNFAKRHELAHLFHVIALRAIIAENAPELGALTRLQLTEFVEELESGGNYLEFEKIVTDISGVLHVLSPLKSGNERYGAKLKILLHGLKPAILSGRVRFKNGWGIIEIYAKFVSKAPILLGKSFGQLAMRLPLIYFATYYVGNDSFRQMVDLAIANLLH